MLLSTLKNGGQWDFLGKRFKIKGPIFERTIANFLTVIVDTVYYEKSLGEPMFSLWRNWFRTVVRFRCIVTHNMRLTRRFSIQKDRLQIYRKR